MPVPPAKMKILLILARKSRKIASKPFPQRAISHGNWSQSQLSRDWLRAPPGLWAPIGPQAPIAPWLPIGPWALGPPRALGSALPVCRLQFTLKIFLTLFLLFS